MNFEAFPDELRSAPRWVGARLEPRDNRMTKVPYRIAEPATRASSTDPATWSDFAAARAVVEAGRLPLLGFVLGDGFVGVDLDKCRDAESGVVEPWAREIITLLDAYAEVSVSGTGVHIICRGTLPAGGRRKGGIEMYDAARFFVTTGDVIGSGEVVDRTTQLADLHARVFGADTAANATSSQAPVTTIADDDELLRRIRASKQAAKFEALWAGDTAAHKGDDSAADQALCTILAFWTARDRERIDRLFRRSGLFRQKWERDDYRQKTLDRACAIKEVYEPGAAVLDAGDPLKSAREFVKRRLLVEGVRAVQHQQDVFFAFDRDASAYGEQEIAAVRAALYRFLDAAKTIDEEGRIGPFKPTKGKVEQVIDALRAECQLPARKAPPCWLRDDPGLDPIEIVACRNGLLHVPTRTLLPATPHFFTLNGLDLAYDAQAPQPVDWLKFLASVWPDDQESIDALQEIFGYLLTPDTRFQKIPMVVGPKRSGKGTIARVLRRLVGARNTCSPTLAAFGRDFGKQVLINKTLALISDARISGRTDTAVVAETLLSISGEDDQTIERKFLSDWNGRLTVRFLLLANELPRIGDASGALASRFVVLVMKQSFYGREDLGLSERLGGELPGILNWALEGRDRLYARGHLVQPASANDMLEEFQDLASPEAAFLREECEVHAGAEVAQADLYSAWCGWCQVNGHKHPGTKQTFGRSLRAVASWIGDVNRRDGDERVRFWTGLRLRDRAQGREVADGRMPF